MLQGQLKLIAREKRRQLQFVVGIWRESGFLGSNWAGAANAAVREPEIVQEEAWDSYEEMSNRGTRLPVTRWVKRSLNFELLNFPNQL